MTFDVQEYINNSSWTQSHDGQQPLSRLDVKRGRKASFRNKNEHDLLKKGGIFATP